jgi:competence protein ComGD
MIRNSKKALENEYKHQEAFTLIEVLLIFFILVVMLSSLPPLFHSVEQTINEKYFLQQYEEDLFYAQTLALSKRRYVYYSYDDAKRTYKIMNGLGEVYLQRKIPDSVKMSHGHLSRFHFNSNGNISQFGNIWVEVNGKKYKIFISIGSGRFEIFEQSTS